MLQKTPNGTPVVLDAGEWMLDGRLHGDEANAVARWLADPMVAHALGRTPGQPDAARADRYIHDFDRIASHLLIARRKEDGTPEAMVAVRMDGRNLVADVDIVVGARTTRNRDGQQLLLRAGWTVASWVFLHVGMEKIMARVLERNRRTADWAGRLLRHEGTLHGHVRLPDGTRHTVLQFGLLRDEWKAKYLSEAGTAQI